MPFISSGMDTSSDAPHSGASSQRSTPHDDKAAKMSRQDTNADKSALDGATPPVQTIIFENTNYKAAPQDMALKAKFGNHMKSQKLHKMDDATDSAAALGYDTIWR